MCGIAGYVGSAGSRVSLENMARAIQRRGPDDEGFYEGSGVGFAFRRLSIIDVAGGHQPLSNEDGSVWVMLNGEIYGFQAVRDELLAAGHQFKTHSDTEVIAHGYEEWGEEIFRHLNGMFAIAIWDVPRSRLLLARDRLGKKPLYWGVRDGTLWFASEMKALLANGVIEREIDLISLGLYFRTDAVPTPRSIFRDVYKLEPATVLVWEEGRVAREHSFWGPPACDINTENDATIIRAFGKTVDQAVRERLVSDVPLGIFLSGGLDSAVIAESAARQSSSRLQAFTIGFDDPSHDETVAAQSVAQAFCMDHHVARLSAAQVLEMLDEAVGCLDEPLADPAILPQMLLARFTKQFVTVAVAGDGGDELLLGYQHIPVHEWARRHPTFWQRARVFRSLADWVPAGGGYFSLGFKAQRLARGLGIADMWTRDVAWRGAYTRHGLEAMLRPEIRASVHVEEAERLLAARAGELSSGATDWQRWSWAYLRTFLMDEVMVKVDRATMWFGIEGRAPLLDTRVVEAAFHLPDHLKIGKGAGKKIFQELLRGTLPPAIIERPKHGFGVPTAEWLRGPLRERLRELTTPTFLDRQGLFVPRSIERLMQEHQTRRVDRRKELWALLCFQWWWERWIGKV